MTLDYFLDVYVPNVLRPMGGWWVKDGWLRRDDPTVSESDCFEVCPLTAEARRAPGDWRVEADRLGLDRETAGRIADAADAEGWQPEIRARLLAGLGLSEAE
jgi:hypothetical protein